MLLVRYIAAEVARGYLLAALVLGGLMGMLATLEEVEDMGVGDYGLAEAVFVVGASLPGLLLSWLPFIVLLGTLQGLSSLASRGELDAIRAAGVSAGRLTAAAVLPAVVLAVLTLPFDNWIAAPQYREALLVKSLARTEGGNVLAGSGFWARAGDTFVNVGELDAGEIPRGVTIYNFDSNRQLVQITQAPVADTDVAGGAWLLRDAAVNRLAVDRLERERHAAMRWQPVWAASLPMEPVPPASLAFGELRRLRDYKADSGQPTVDVDVSFWRRALMPLSVLVMAVLAVPFVVGQGRMAQGTRLLTGVVVGLGYYLLEQLVLNAGVLAGIPPWLLALVPMAAALALAAVLARRMP